MSIWSVDKDFEFKALAKKCSNVVAHAPRVHSLLYTMPLGKNANLRLGIVVKVYTSRIKSVLAVLNACCTKSRT